MADGSRLYAESECEASTATPIPQANPGQPLQQQGLLGGLPLEREQINSPSDSHKPKEQCAPKVAIPRLRRGIQRRLLRELQLHIQGEVETATAPGSLFIREKGRVTHACESCRQKKTKCSGDKPSCKHCREFTIACVYTDRNPDKPRREVGAMARRIDEYERLLRVLALRVNANDQRLIRKTIENNFLRPDDDETPSLVSSQKATASTEYGSADGEMDGEADTDMDDELETEIDDDEDEETYALARVGSTGSMDNIKEDFNRTAASRATGFMGKNSELTWMQRLRSHAEFGAEEPSLQPLSESTYHCDDLSMLILDHVDPYAVPPRHVADSLFKSYLETVHPAFPIIGRTTFLNQYRTYYSKNVQAGPDWLAILNLIFAIGARYSHLIQADWKGDEKEHLIYFTRARTLGFKADSIFDHAGLQRIQIAGLMAFYLTAINQINRAWTFSGIAMRQACTLGLNLQNDSKSVIASSKEVRSRVWWAVCSAECRLSVMTGRLSAFTNVDFTVPLPLPIEEGSFSLPTHSAFNNQEVPFHPRDSGQASSHMENDPFNPSFGSSTEVKVPPTGSTVPILYSHQTIGPSHALYFLIQTRLSLFTNEVLHQLYRPKVVMKSWAQIQVIISTLEVKIGEWLTCLPPVFDFFKHQRDQQFSRQRMSLGFFYYSTLMIIYRPCLCRINRKLPHASEKSREFNRATAAKCVHAAKNMLGLLPNEPNPIALYKITPWWCLVHHLVQAATVLMLELSYQADHLPNEVGQILQSAGKAVHWLRSMAEADLAAHRAWRLCDDMLRKVAAKVGRKFDTQPEGNSTDVELPDGDMPDGELPTPDGDLPDRDMPDRDLPNRDFFWDMPVRGMPVGDLPDRDGNGNDGGGLFQYPITRMERSNPPYFSSARPEEPGTQGMNYTPFPPTEGFYRQELPDELPRIPIEEIPHVSIEDLPEVTQGPPLDLIMYTLYDEFFPPPAFLDFPPQMTAQGSPTDFLSVFPNPNQMDGVISGDKETLSHYTYGPD